MNLFFTSDTHFDHSGILRHCKRPQLRPGDLRPDGKWVSKQIADERTEEMNQFLIDRWNSVVTGKDMVIIIGDFAWKRHLHFLGALKGKKVLIRGNHDDMSQEVEKNFTEVHDCRMVKLPGGHAAFCFHYCCHSWPESGYGVYHFHGHSHARIRETEGLLRTDVCVDAWDYTPVAAEILVMKMEEYAKKGVTRFNGEADRNVEANRAYNVALLNKVKAQKETAQ